jgi:hypothetical protein
MHIYSHLIDLWRSTLPYSEGPGYYLTLVTSTSVLLACVDRIPTVVHC